MLDVALLQLRTPANQADALAHVAPLIDEAANGGARLILTPEGTNLLQRDRAALLAAVRPADQDVCVLGLREKANQHGVWILVGSAMLAGAGDKAVNRSLLIDPSGAIVAAYDKIHLFDVDLAGGERYRESTSFTPGEQAVTAEVDGVRLGLSVCYDLRFAALYRALAKAGAQVLSVPAAFTRPTGEAHWRVLLRARAIETGAFVLAAAQGGSHQDGRATFGHSAVIGPWGEVLAEAEDDRPGIVRARLDLGEAAKARASIPALEHDRVFTGP
jgi:predicted amidohydrolase